MQHIFIINPAAGQGKSTGDLKARITEDCRMHDIEPVIYETTCPGDAETASARIASGLAGEPAVFYARGGDGTAGEVLNGIVDFPDVSLAIVPTGTGNDTIRNFDVPEKSFSDIHCLLAGKAVPVDLLRYRGEVDGMETDRFCINMFNNGFDANVVAASRRMKELPLVSGSLAYLLGILQMFIQKKGISLAIYADDECVSEGPILLAAVSNGCYCGGGIKSSPQSIVDDGFMDLNIIQNTTRRRFLRLFPSFSKGKHLGDPAYEDILTTIKCRSVKLLPYETASFQFCVDGELAMTTGLTIDICPHAMSFIVPAAE